MLSEKLGMRGIHLYYYSSNSCVAAKIFFAFLRIGFFYHESPPCPRFFLLDLCGKGFDVDFDFLRVSVVRFGLVAAPSRSVEGLAVGFSMPQNS